MDGYKNTGVPDEACFPYVGSQQACNQCADWQNRVTKITGWHTITAAADMKAWLSTQGPLATCFTVYNDFFAYTNGVYKHVSGGVAGGHCVCVVGYNDAGGYWICKNSWGTGWGQAGFFYIAYGECGIDSTMWAPEGILETGWLNNTRVIGLWTIDQDRNAWAYLSGVGWRKIATDNDNIFIDLLRLLAAAKEGGRPINVYQDNAVLKQIYVL
jgi:C1A family cysteine protease